MNVAIYIRKSKFTGKGDSIENQVQMCKDYLLNQNRHNYTYQFYVYEDEGFSGGNTNRPEFQKLMNDIALKKFHILICYRLDRISRNVADFSSTLEILQRYNVDFVSIREQFDTSSPMGRAMIYIASVFAQLERETIAERVRDNMLELAKSGRWLGGTPPLGYKSTPITYYDENMSEHLMSVLSADNKELRLVKLIYHKYLELQSLNSLEAYLLKNYYKTRTGCNFRKSTLKLILTNPVYVKSNDKIFDYLSSKGMTLCGESDNIHGYLTYNKLKTINLKDGNHTREFRSTSDWIVAVSKHKGIIESDDWLEVQKIYARNNNKFIASARSHNALLTGIIKCANCGSSMRIMHGPISKKTGAKLFYYVCTLKQVSKGTRCRNPNGKVNEIDTIVMNSIKNLYESNEMLIKCLIEKNNLPKRPAFMSDPKSNINTLIVKKKEQIDNLLNKVSLNPELEDVIIPKIKNLKEELSKLNKDLNSLNDEIEQINMKDLNFSFMKRIEEGASVIDSLTYNEIKELIKGMVKSITWNGVTGDLNLNFIGSKDN